MLEDIELTSLATTEEDIESEEDIVIESERNEENIEEESKKNEETVRRWASMAICWGGRCLQ